MRNRQARYKLVLLLLAMLCPITLLAGSISDIEDLFVGVWSPFGRHWEKSVPICLTGNAGDTSYRVRASSLNNPARFTLDNNIGDRVRYQVYWHTGNALKKRKRLQPNIESKHPYDFNAGASCSTGPNAKLRVKINNRDISQAVPGIYDDTLLITLSPL